MKHFKKVELSQTIKIGGIILASACIIGFAGLSISSISNLKLELNSTTIKLESKTKKLENLKNQYEKKSKKLDDAKKSHNQSQERIKQLEQEKNELEQKLQAKAHQQSKKNQANKQIASASNGTSASAVSGSRQDWMTQAGINPSDFGYVDFIVSRESSWNYTIANKSSGAYGLCQALPASKMASAGSDWRTNPVTQLRWCNSYALGRYGSWSAAVSFWRTNHWW